MLFFQSVVILIVKLIPLVIALFAGILSLYEFLESFFEPDFSGRNYDFIIVGAGSAGSVLASRLSEDESVSVLLIEAGGAPSFLTAIPALTAFLQLSSYDWQFETEPQANACLSMVGQRCKWPRGKMLGGSSGLNYMLYVRGNPQDFDHWSSLGNDGWSYQEVLPYFKKSEDQLGRYSKDTKNHGLGGPLPVRDSIFVTPLAEIYASMAERLGFGVHDINGANQTGFDVPQVNLDTSGRRADTFRSFIRGNVERRPNLFIMKHTQATRLIFKEDKKTALGVEVNRYGKTFLLRATKEVVLSAGAVGSPHLLLLSGVGPEKELRKHMIPVVLAQENVGFHLQDHVTTMLGPFFVNEPLTFDLAKFLKFSTVWDYFIKGSGPMAATVACDTLGFLSTSNNTTDPMYQYHLNAVPVYSDFGNHIPLTFGLNRESWDEFLSQHYGREAVTILPVLLHPKSRGRVGLRSVDPLQPPVIDPEYLTNQDDVRDLVEAVQLIRKMLKTSPELNKLEFELPSNAFPDCKADFLKEPFGDDYWACYIKHVTLTMYHPVGSCRMGPHPSSSVVDSKLRVHGLANVRVVDASIMPEIVSGNTNAAVIMIAEKAGDMIKADWSMLKSNQKLPQLKDEL